MTFILGITGGIGAGKSSVVALFAELGVPVVSADQLARQAVAPGTPALAELVVTFGSQILAADGTLDRAILATQVFADPAARARLEAITHPAIAALAVQRLDELRASGVPLAVYEAPLLYEAHAEGRVDLVLTVIADPAVQRLRLAARDSLGAAAIEARIAAQWPQAEKAARADFVIDNSGDLAATRRQVLALYRYLINPL